MSSDLLLKRLGAALEGKRVLPVIQPGEAEAVTGLFHAQIDRGTEARARAIEASGQTIACGEGCSQCCNNMPAIFDGEAVTIARWLEAPEHAAARAGFEARYPAWYAAVADLVERWNAAAAADDTEAAAEAGREVWRRQVMCAFNEAGRCTIYEVRPGICRTAHALEKVCDPATGDEVTAYRFEPLEAYLVRIQPMQIALHTAIRRDRVGRRPLCVAVQDYLGSK